MEDVKIRPYTKKFSHSYSFGVYPTIELLKYRPKEVIKVLLHSRGRQNEGVKKIQDLCRKLNVRTEFADGLINKLSLSENTYAVGVFKKYSMKLVENSNQVVLVGPQDAGNLGTIVRSALGFGVADIAIIKPGVDCFEPKVMRASMGSLFRARIEYFDDIEAYLKEHENNRYLFMVDGEKELNGVDFISPLCPVFRQ